MRRMAWLAFALLLAPAPAAAEQPRCPLPLDTCIVRFGRMRERPYLGIYFTMDSLGVRTAASVVPGSPADRAGVRAGDVVTDIGGQPPEQYFMATRAGWKTGDLLPIGVRRRERAHALALRCEPIPEELFARIVGEHMLEAHLAYMDSGEPEHGPH